MSITRKASNVKPSLVNHHTEAEKLARAHGYDTLNDVLDARGREFEEYCGTPECDEMIPGKLYTSMIGFFNTVDKAKGDALNAVKALGYESIAKFVKKDEGFKRSLKGEVDTYTNWQLHRLIVEYLNPKQDVSNKPKI